MSSCYSSSPEPINEGAHGVLHPPFFIFPFLLCLCQTTPRGQTGMGRKRLRGSARDGGQRAGRCRRGSVSRLPGLNKGRKDCARALPPCHSTCKVETLVVIIVLVRFSRKTDYSGSAFARPHRPSRLRCARRYVLEYLKRNWDRLGEFDEAFSGVDIDEMGKAVQPLLVAEGATGCSSSWWYTHAGNVYACLVSEDAKHHSKAGRISALSTYSIYSASDRHKLSSRACLSDLVFRADYIPPEIML